MRFAEALEAIQGHADKFITNEHMVAERHCYVRVQGPHHALKLVNFKTKLEQDWVPSLNDLTSQSWQVLEDK